MKKEKRFSTSKKPCTKSKTSISSQSLFIHLSFFLFFSFLLLKGALEVRLENDEVMILEEAFSSSLLSQSDFLRVMFYIFMREKGNIVFRWEGEGKGLFYDVWKAGVEGWKKSRPPLPHFRVFLVPFRSCVPSVIKMKQIIRLTSPIPLVCATYSVGTFKMFQLSMGISEIKS